MYNLVGIYSVPSAKSLYFLKANSGSLLKGTVSVPDVNQSSFFVICLNITVSLVTRFSPSLALLKFEHFNHRCNPVAHLVNLPVIHLLLINPFFPNALFLYPLKTPENLRFSDIFRG